MGARGDSHSLESLIHDAEAGVSPDAPIDVVAKGADAACGEEVIDGLLDVDPEQQPDDEEDGDEDKIEGTIL